MPLPTPNLDDLRFQRDLVDEARRRIIRYCPEWTDYNLSDPGITLIELFAWMTEMLVYRLNRVPEKNHVQFLELLGIKLQPASSARTELTFWLSAPFPLHAEDTTTAVIPQGTEVATWATEEEPEVIFTTDSRLVVGKPTLTWLLRKGDFNRDYSTRLGIEDFYAFDRQRPQEEDAFYIGFDESHDISGYVLRLTFECRETQAAGIRRADPPLMWECSLGNDVWQEAVPSTLPGEQDTTGGLNNARGSLALYLPTAMKPDQVYGRNGYWVRCRLKVRREGQLMYTQSPRIRGIAAHVLGGTAWATHGQVVSQERLGRSSGEPGQVFHLRYAPVLDLGPGQDVEVEEEQDGEVVYVPWERVEDFSLSTIYDRHFTLDESTGEVSFGPSVIQSDGTVRQYGRVPEAGRSIRITQYRHGGGTVGNLPVRKLQVLRSAIPYIDRVANLKRASGGRDQESLEEAKVRAQREVRAQQRAVTAEDFEVLAKQASRAVARAKCNTSRDIASGAESAGLPPGMVDLLVVPAAFDALRAGDLSRLAVEQPDKNEVRSYLDRYRLLTCTVNIREPRYLGIKVHAQIVVSEHHQVGVVVARVRELIKLFITPLALETEDQVLADILEPGWEGWPFGRDLYVSEIYSLIQRVPGVKHVLDVQLGQRAVVPARELAPQESSAGDSDAAQAEAASTAEQEEAAAAGQRAIEVPPDTLLCLLDCQVEVVRL